MNLIRVFISSVRREFAEERKSLCEYIRRDALLGDYFEPFVFEEVPANELSPREIYSDVVKQSDIYLGLLGEYYGDTRIDGVSPTELEYNIASELQRTCLFQRLSGI